MSGNAATVLTKPGFRKIEWLKRDIAVERRGYGVIVLQSRIPLKPYEKHIPASLSKWARERADRVWLAQRAGSDRQWRKLCYAERPAGMLPWHIPGDRRGPAWGPRAPR